jgi:hypothetical protein
MPEIQKCKIIDSLPEKSRLNFSFMKTYMSINAKVAKINQLEIKEYFAYGLFSSVDIYNYLI